jgi:hypothetical protein
MFVMLHHDQPLRGFLVTCGTNTNILLRFIPVAGAAAG